MLTDSTAAAQALRSLETSLAASLGTFGLRASIVGDVENLARAVSCVIAGTRGHRIGHPSTENSAGTALRFLRGEQLDDADLDRLAWALCTPVGEPGRIVCSDPRFAELLQHYGDCAVRGTLWRVSWLGLLGSYLAFDASRADARGRAGWEALRALLSDTWPRIVFPAGYEPQWAAVVRAHPRLLSRDPCAEFAGDYLEGDSTRVDAIERDLGIPRTSWFWRELLLAAVDRAIGMPDARFKRALGGLVRAMRARGAGRDEAIGRLLERYALCADRSPDPQFRDYVIDRTVWNNPKLMLTGAAPAWSALSRAAWRMATGWVSDASLRVFFDLLVRYNDADEGRREFWSRYAGQIACARLAIGAQTLQRARSDAALARVLSPLEGDVALLRDGWQAVDALMIEIGEYLFVEFSVNASTCYAYPRENLPFDPEARTLSGGSADLKAAYYHRGEPRDLRIAHGPDWPARMAGTLARIGVFPDRARERAPDAVH